MASAFAAASQRALGRRAFSSDALLKTMLYDLHLERGGKMVPFAGYELPVQYAGIGVLKEHMHCRSPGKSSLFDVSHMGQIKWTGADRAKFLERVRPRPRLARRVAPPRPPPRVRRKPLRRTAVVGDVAGLGDGEGRLTLLTNAEGGILDDCMHYQGDDATLVALQGAGAPGVLLPLLPDGFDMTHFAFMTGVDTSVGGYACRVTRCGYTGEDGFEIAVADPANGVAVAELLLGSEGCEPCGLGARDSLRLEAGLCLYGHDLDTSVNPIEGTLLWTIGPKGSRRRVDQGTLGMEHYLNANGSPKKFARKRFGFMGHAKPAREGTAIFDAAGETQVGVVTSGTVSPVLGKPIAMGFVETALAKKGTDVTFDIRGKKIPSQVAPMPFVEPNYDRVPE
ncbi:aminomethyltransferase [Aureococcus anophagefferens]|nr:aminomethyltransferase [Aureococcus anophagefferens]